MTSLNIDGRAIACRAAVTNDAPPNTHRKKLVGLDLIRGIAALAVLVYHVDFMFGLRGLLLPSGYLAVDLFFILSGFVISYTYEDSVRTGRLGFWPMAMRRIARLYPLYLLTFVIGLFVMTARFHSHAGYYDLHSLFISAIANVLILPSFSVPNQGEALFPFNAASWSIFYELVINAVFFVALARLGTRLLVVAWVLSVAALCVAAQTAGTLDVGWGAANFLLGFPRVTCSFLTGMLLWRRYQHRPWYNAGWPVFALIIVFLAIAQTQLVFPVPRSWSDVIVVTIFMPGLVITGIGAGFGPYTSRTASFLGEISYAVYLTQDFLIIAAAGMTQYLLGTKIYDFAPIAGFVFVPSCVALSYLSYRFFEKPARFLLRKR